MVLSNTFPMKMSKTSGEDVVFKDRDSDGLLTPTVDPMVVTIGIGPAIVRRVLVDSGASVNVLFINAFSQMKLSMADMRACPNKIHGFTVQPTQPVGVIDLLVELGEGEKKVAMIQTFVVVDEHSAYNAFLGKPTLTAFKIALAPWCLTTKFPTERGVVVIKGDQKTARECYMAELVEAKRKEMGKNAGPPLRIRDTAL